MDGASPHVHWQLVQTALWAMAAALFALFARSGVRTFLMPARLWADLRRHSCARVLFARLRPAQTSASGRTFLVARGRGAPVFSVAVLRAWRHQRRSG